MVVGPYDAFISYSHAADGQFAPQLQRGLSRLAKPWYRRQAVRVFRDDTGLSVTPELWGSIAEALDRSSFLILLASPEAAGSDWVGRELDHWLTAKGPESILPVVTAGEWAWDTRSTNFSPESTAVPPRLRGAFPDEPRHLDARWAHAERLTLRDGRFRNAVAELAAPIRHMPKEDLESEDLRLHRRALRLARTAVAALAVLTIAAVIGAVFAIANAHRAEQRRQEGLARELAAQSINLVGNDLRGALAVASAGVSVRSTQQTQQALLSVLQHAPRIEQFRDNPASTTAVSGAFSPDGQTYFVAAARKGQGVVTVYRSDVVTPLAIRSPFGSIENAQWLPANRLLLVSSRGMAISDGRHAATRLFARAPGSPVRVSKDGRSLIVFPDRTDVDVVNLESGKIVYRGAVDPTQGAPYAALSPDGSLAAVTTAGAVVVVDAIDGSTRSRVPGLSHATFVPVTGGTLIANVDNQVARFAINAATPSWSVPVPGPVLATAFSPDGTGVAFRTQQDTTVVDLGSGAVRWRTANRAVPPRPPDFQPGAAAVAFSANSRHLMEDGPEGATLWDATTAGPPLWSDPNFQLVADGVQPNGHFAVVSNDGTGVVAASTTLLDLDQGTSAKTIGAGTVHAAWRTDGQQALTAGTHAAFLWNLADLTSAPEPLTGVPVAGGVFDPFNIGFVTFGQGPVAQWFARPAAAPAVVHALSADTEDFDPVSGVSLILDRSGGGSALHVVDAQGRVRFSFPVPAGTTVPRVLPGGQRALFDLGGGVALVDLTNGKTIRTGTVCGTSDRLGLVVSANGHYLAGVGTDRGVTSLTVCDTTTSRIRARTRAPQLLLADRAGREIFGEVAVSGDGRRVAFAPRDDQVVAVDTHTGGVVTRLRLRQRAVLYEGLTGATNLALEVAFSSNDRFLAAGSGREVDVADLNGGRVTGVSLPTVVSGVYPTRLAVDPSGQFVFLERAGTQADQSQTEWILANAASGESLGVLAHGTLHVEATRTASFDRASRLRLFVPRPNPVSVLYPVRVEDLRRLACGIAGGALAPATWHRLLPQTDYVNGCGG